MAKKLVIVGFLLCFGLALWTYLTRDKKSLRENLTSGQRDPRVVMEDFSIYRYEAATIRSRLMAKLGHFYEPNVVELDGEVRAERRTLDGVETATAETATAIFNAKSLRSMMGQKLQLDKAELAGFVEVGVKRHLLSTDYAEFINKDSIVRSSRPVRVEGPGRVFTGDEGFVYSLSNETLDMPGQVKGVVKLDETR
jgi:hypothetical protein